MNNTKAFSPAFGKGVTISASTTTSRVIINRAGDREQVSLSNDGSDTVFVNTGDVAVTVVSPEGFAILPGTEKVITFNRDHTHLAVITASGTSLLHVIVGIGL